MATETEGRVCKTALSVCRARDTGAGSGAQLCRLVVWDEEGLGRALLEAQLAAPGHVLDREQRLVHV